MNILFYYSSNIEPTKGGVQRVTNVLANHFVKAGYQAYYLSLATNTCGITNQFVLPNPKQLNDSQNLLYIQNLIADKEINVIINQDGMNPTSCRFIEKAKTQGVKLITVCHNAPLGVIKNFSLVRGEDFKKRHLSFLLPVLNLSLIKKVIVKAYKLKYHSHYLKVLKASDNVVLLSDSYKGDIRYLVGHKEDLSNVIAIPNPCTIEKGALNEKKNVVLSVGRISYSQKRNDLLLKVWSNIESSVPNWKLKIVGDGPDLDNLKRLAENLRLKNVEFIGFANPLDYYVTSRVLCMTSAYEGFPLVLAEAMTNGLVPMGFGSYSAIYDIVNDGIDGFIIKPFDIETYSEKLMKLLQMPNMLNKMSENAKVQADKFSIEEIGKKWFEILK